MRYSFAGVSVKNRFFSHSCSCVFFYAEQMALLCLDAHGLSVVISNIPHNVIFAPALTLKLKALLSAAVSCVCVRAVLD